MILRRLRDLALLIPSALLVAIGFASVLANDTGDLSNLSLFYGAGFLGLVVVAHVITAIALPDADPYLLPLIAVLACFGLVELYRIDETLARGQGTWFIVGLVAYSGTIYALRKDYRVLRDYRNVLALAGVLLLLAPRLRGSATPRTAPTSRSRSGRSGSSRPSSRSSASSSTSRATSPTTASCSSRRPRVRSACCRR